MSSTELMITKEKTKMEIKSPYPGLRPFQAEDSEFFFGREKQITEIVNRLKANRVVAVIGGSGSGKSSLVLAGAIPKLRSFAIRDSGDFWIPIITTPGTNYTEGKNPLRRLAEKFCEVLKVLPLQEELNRIETCAHLLSQKNGLNMLINEFGRDLKNNQGVDLSLKAYSERVDVANPVDLDEDSSSDSSYLVKVNFLFIIDQFEELFHPSNVSVAKQCELLVARIIDHFKSGNQTNSRICVAITMRSEHLNECPRYQELPDVINSAVYLVKRLDKDNLRKAIELPAKAFLRRQFQDERQHAIDTGLSLPDEDNWPEDICFDSNIIERLLSDAEEIVSQQDHADQLPLLQHLLYWIWISATNRVQSKGHRFSFPIKIIEEDLWKAIDNSEEPKKLEKNENTLTNCLKQRCDWIFNRYKANNKEWVQVFQCLAFKEPNTGTYTQRRASITELCTMLNFSEQNEEDKLKNLLGPWLGPHQYLCWDESSHTIKVTHESFIRRWKQFRDLVDFDDRQFQEYLQVLENCSLWLENKQENSYLAEGVVLRRIEDFKLNKGLTKSFLQQRFETLLQMHRDKDRFKVDIQKVREFIDKSISSRRIKRYIYLPALILIPVFLVLWIKVSIENQFGEKMEFLSNAYKIAAQSQLDFPDNYSTKDPEESQIFLQNVLVASSLKQEGEKEPSALAYYSWFFNFFNIPLYPDSSESLRQSTIFSESRTISTMRRALIFNVWPNLKKSGADQKVPQVKELDCPQLEISNTSNKLQIGKFLPLPVSYRLVPQSEKQVDYPLGLILVQDKVENDTQVYWGSRDGNKCITGSEQMIHWSGSNEQIAFDSELKYLVGSSSNPDITYIKSIDWPVNQKLNNKKSVPTTLRVITKQSLLSDSPLFLETIKPEEAYPFASDIKIGKTWYRIFQENSVGLLENQDFKKLEDMPSYKNSKEMTKGTCNSLKNSDQAWVTKPNSSGDNIDIYCIIIKHLDGDGEYTSDNNSGTYRGDLYRVEKKEIKSLSEIKKYPLFSDIDFGKEQPTVIKLNVTTGHLFSKIDDNDGWLMQPWSLKAWAKAAVTINKNNTTLQDKDSRFLRAKYLFEKEYPDKRWDDYLKKAIEWAKKD